MRKTALSLKKTKVNGKTFWQVTVPNHANGGRTRRTFLDKGEAETFFQFSKVQVQNHGTAAMTIPDALRVMAMDGERQLAPFGKNIRDAVAFYLAHLKAVAGSKPVADVVTALLAAKAADGASTRYLGDLRARLNRFAATFGERMIASITGKEIDGWLRSLDAGGVTRNSYRRRVSTLFAFALSNEWLALSPIEAVNKAREKPGATGILTPEQIAKLLEVASVETLPYWAIGAFAGLRAAELARLDWAEVDFEQGMIEVKAAKSKTSSRRLIPIAGNLREWLAPYAGERGPVCPTGLRKRTEADREQAGLRAAWPQNALRHSFGSYRLANLQDAGKTALEMGNSPAMVFRHYRELVKPKAAARYWAISPATPANVVSLSA